MDEARLQVATFIKVIARIYDFRNDKGKRYPISLLLFALFITELKNCRRQRQRIRWFGENWYWIYPLWYEKIGKKLEKEEKEKKIIAGEKIKENNFDISKSIPSQSTLSRVLNKINLWALMEQYHEERRNAVKDLGQVDITKNNKEFPWFCKPNDEKLFL